MPTNTTYNPVKVSDFNKDCLLFFGISVYDTTTENTNINIDYTLSDDVLITGASLRVKGASFGDKATLQIVHPTLGVVNEFVTDWYMVDSDQKQIELQITYPAKLVSGLKIRLVYKPNSTAGTRYIACNYFLHKVMV